ncbi:MAG: hypothetical protein AB7G28_26435 [Pirellulales bacterium]
MAGSRQPDESSAQLPLDFESVVRERHAMLISALTVTGTLKQCGLARLVFYCESRYGDAVQLRNEALAERLGVTRRTVQYWVRRLTAAGIFTYHERRHQAGGSRSNLLSIDWDRVRELAVDRRLPVPATGVQNRGAKTPDRGANRGANFAPPIRNDLPLSSQYKTSTTSCASSVANERREEVENFLRTCRKLLPTPRQLDEAVDAALAAGCTLAQLAKRAKWFQEHQTRWSTEHRRGVLYHGFKDCRPEYPTHEGWPYQR